MTEDWVRSGIGHSTADAITVRGHDLADDLMGKVSFADLAYMLVARRTPTAGEARVFDAVLVSHAHMDHCDLGTLRRIPRKTRAVSKHGVSGWPAAAHERCEL